MGYSVNLDLPFLVVVCTFFIVAFRAQNFIDTCCQVKECKRFENEKEKFASNMKFSGMSKKALYI